MAGSEAHSLRHCVLSNFYNFRNSAEYRVVRAELSEISFFMNETGQKLPMCLYSLRTGCENVSI